MQVDLWATRPNSGLFQGEWDFEGWKIQPCSTRISSLFWIIMKKSAFPSQQRKTWMAYERQPTIAAFSGSIFIRPLIPAPLQSLCELDVPPDLPLSSLPVQMDESPTQDCCPPCISPDAPQAWTAVANRFSPLWSISWPQLGLSNWPLHCCWVNHFPCLRFPPFPAFSANEWKPQ